MINFYNMSEKLRQQWRKEHNVDWSEGTFESVERFVRNAPEEDIRRFIETGELDDLFKNTQAPNPRPVAHINYMIEYAKKYIK